MEILPTLSIFVTLLLSFHGLNNVEGQTPPFNAIYQFGDSISDAGNDVHFNANDGCGKSPYGISRDDKKPTGRCSDGLLIVDYFAKAFNLPLVNPYMDRKANFSQGVNFAVSGANALLNLPDQLTWFKAYRATICSKPAECNAKLQNALFVMGGIGGNDYGLAAAHGKTMKELYAMVPTVVQMITKTIKELIDLGAKRMIVPGSFPVGCMPITLGGADRNNAAIFDKLGCVKSWNEMAAFHNTKLQEAITSIKKQYPGVKIVYGDYYNALVELFQNAPALGFNKNELYQACCIACGAPGSVACPNPKARVSWDGIHMTQAAYQVVANRLLKDVRKL